MGPLDLSGTLVVNFNAPELNQLASALAREGCLARYVRPYVNKGRPWERALAALPLAGRLYGSTFGRRTMPDRALAELTHEAGVLPDLLAATAMRLRFVPDAPRRRMTNAMIVALREAVARAAAAHARDAQCVVAYEGFALPAFEACAARGGSARTVLNYPVAHHRVRRRERLMEIERQPTFASTWPDFDDWPSGHEERLDEEIRLADIVLVGSTYASDSFVAEGIARQRMKVIPYGVDLATFTPRPAHDEPARDPQRFRVIYAGQLTQRKGLSYLLDGYRLYARAGSELLLVGSAVGDPQALKPHAGLYRHLQHQTRGELARLYRSSDVFLFPTLVEGMPLVVLEAMACGLPVIVTANGPGDIVRDGIDGFVVPARDPEAIAGCLDALHRDPELRDAMGRRAAQRAAEFGWSAYTDKALGCLAALCGDAHSGTPPIARNDDALTPTGASSAP